MESTYFWELVAVWISDITDLKETYFPTLIVTVTLAHETPRGVFEHLSKVLQKGTVHMEVGEVPHLGGVTNLSIQFLFFSGLCSHERWGTAPKRGEFSPCEC